MNDLETMLKQKMHYQMPSVLPRTCQNCTHYHNTVCRLNTCCSMLVNPLAHCRYYETNGSRPPIDQAIKDAIDKNIREGNRPIRPVPAPRKTPIGEYLGITLRFNTKDAERGYNIKDYRDKVLTGVVSGHTPDTLIVAIPNSKHSYWIRPEFVTVIGQAFAPKPTAVILPFPFTLPDE